MGFSLSDLSPANAISKGVHWVGDKLGGLTDESQSAIDQRKNLQEQAAAAGGFASAGQQGYGAMTGEAAAQREYLRQVATGQHSVAGEQLRQGLQQNLATQRSLAAGAAPGNAVGAARTAAIQSARLGSGFAGQQAVAGLQEQQQAQRALAEMIMQQRQQDAQVALQSRNTAISGYGGYKPEGSTLDKWGNAITAGASIATKSDRRAKHEIEDGDKAAGTAMRGLRAYTFAYKDRKDGEGKQLGVMAQDLERAGLKHTVIDTPDGKYVHGGKLSTANTALIAALERRVNKLEGGRRGKER